MWLLQGARCDLLCTPKASCLSLVPACLSAPAGHIVCARPSATWCCAGVWVAELPLEKRGSFLRALVTEPLRGILGQGAVGRACHLCPAGLHESARQLPPGWAVTSCGLDAWPLAAVACLPICEGAESPVLLCPWGKRCPSEPFGDAPCQLWPWGLVTAETPGVVLVTWRFIRASAFGSSLDQWQLGAGPGPFTAPGGQCGH